MSAAPDNLGHIGPEWCARPVVTFHGQHDTHIETGEDYGTRTLASLFTMEPDDKMKSEGLAFIPSLYADFDARNHARQREAGSYVALTGDVDCDNHPLATIESLIRGFVKDCAFLIFSSAHARPGDMRWRIIIPIDRALAFEHWHDAQQAFFDYMEAHGVTMDRALARAGQPVYLPNVPEFHAKTGDRLRGEDGAPLHYTRATSGTHAPALPTSSSILATYVSQIRRQREAEERERERIRKEAEDRRSKAPMREGAPVIEEFNRNNSIETLLELYGYERSPRHSEDWRSTHQTGESYATRVMGDFWVSLSGSDAGMRLGQTCKAGCFGDAYDLFVHYEHGGDHKAAFRALYAERRASLPMQHSEPPPAQADDPGPEPEDFGEPDLEPEHEAGISADGTPRLPFFWFHDAQPNLDANDFVEGLLTSSAMSVIYGPSNCGKTFFVVDLALHVSLGREWRGRAVDRGAVVYLSLEGAQGIRNRLAAFRKHHELNGEQLPFVAMPQPVNLLNEDADVHAVIELVNHVASETGIHVAMVIVDTLSRAMAGGNENSPEDMTAIVGNCDRIRDATGAHVCIVHHSGKDEARGARGHSSLRAATDTEIEITREEGADSSNVRVAKQRDLEAADPFAFALRSVPLGTNRRGRDVTSCVVMGAEKESARGLSRDAIVKAFALMVDAWTEGRPLSHKPRAKDTGRYAPMIFRREFGGDSRAWAEHIEEWIYTECVAFEVRDHKTKLAGLRVLKPIF
jgi:hypothetical protein